ncbi:type II toxin-antitoxin system PemK/MazF family toxin [Weissella cibaria]|uniref:type II toxin-antitoxin system PemK/MazF family toxin n=1 Tax=Weissella cibaria TaxID=137591 RepID=UPI00106E9730|nr:type II toxin-antitoxin system PemK/MazF family toxin [Weissella cibaria]
MEIKQGDIFWVDSEPHAGSEFGGHNAKANNIRRPVVVVSGNMYNRAQAPFVVVVPVTSGSSSQEAQNRLENDPLALPILVKNGADETHGFMFLHQLLGYDLEARNAEYVGQIDATTLRVSLKIITKQIFA